MGLFADTMPATISFIHIAIIGIMYCLLRVTRRSISLHAIVWWPSTCAHELCHFLVGFLLAAKPVGFTVFPKRGFAQDQWILGQVSFSRLRWWNKLPVSLAPLLLLPIVGLWLFIQSISIDSVNHIAILCDFGALQCFNGATLSSADWSHARDSLIVITSLAAAVFAGYLFFAR
jgi:hypothetical protein